MLYDHVEMVNPTFASYFMKPTDMFQTLKNEGLSALTSKLGAKTSDFMSKTSGGQEFVEQLGNTLSKQFVNAGASEGIERRDKYDKMEPQDIRRHVENIKNTGPMDYLDIAMKFGEAIKNPGEALRKNAEALRAKYDVKHQTETIQGNIDDMKLEL